LIEIMNLDSLSFALSQISYSVANLTKKNYKANITEISTVSNIFIYVKTFLYELHLRLVVVKNVEVSY